MKALVASVVTCALAAACAFGAGGSLDEDAPGVMRGVSPSPTAVFALASHPAVAKRDFETAFGRANVIAFDSGWEVWAYRWPGADRSTQSATEVVLLFDPSGKLRKARERRGEGR